MKTKSLFSQILFFGFSGLAGVMILTTLLKSVLPAPQNMNAEDWKTYNELGEQIKELDNQKIEQLKTVKQTSETLSKDQQNLKDIQAKIQDLIKQKNEIEAKYSISITPIPEVKASEKQTLNYTLNPGDTSNLTWYAFKASEKQDNLVYITATMKQHFAKNGMLAMDFGTKGRHADLYAPDFNGKVVQYTYKNAYYESTTGKTILLEWDDQGVKKQWLLGHIHEFNSSLKEGDQVLTGDLLGKVGGCNNEADEGVSTGCHLHLEYYRDGIRTTYPEDFGIQHEYSKLDQINYYIENYNSAPELKGSGEIWLKFQDQYKVKAEVAVCIAVADTGLGRSLKTKFNYGNYGNTDSGRTVSFETKEQGIEAIYKALTNDSLKNKQTVGSLSYGGGGTGAIYASSRYNWNYNVLACLTKLNKEKATKDYLIRL